MFEWILNTTNIISIVQGNTMLVWFLSILDFRMQQLYNVCAIRLGETQRPVMLRQAVLEVPR